MGMHTELIFGASLKEDTPTEVIETLKYMMGYREEKPTDFPFNDVRCERLFSGSSFYFGVHKPVNKMIYDEVVKNWMVSTRSNIKNYNGEIETFLEWIKPHIGYGSGAKNMYAIVTYEESNYPKIYYLD